MIGSLELGMDPTVPGLCLLERQLVTINDRSHIDIYQDEPYQDLPSKRKPQADSHWLPLVEYYLVANE